MSDEQIALKPSRLSNFEALRIVCALMIVFVHANFWTIGRPNWDLLSTQPTSTVTRIFLQLLCIPSTYAFVLISGYFGIHVRLKGILNLIFILIFWKGVWVCEQILLLGWDLEILKGCNPFVGWFIPAYIALLCFVPALNSFADPLDRRQLGRYLKILLPVVMGCDCLYLINCFNGGYSALGLMAAYLLGKFLGKPVADNFGESRLRSSALHYILLYLLCVGMWTISFCGVLILFHNHAVIESNVLNSLLMYTSPIALACSVLLFQAFKKMNFQSSVINWIALSSFPIIGYHLFFRYQGTVHDIYDRYNGLSCMGIIMLWGLLVALGIIVIDQVRIFIWRGFASRFQNKVLYV